MTEIGLHAETIPTEPGALRWVTTATLQPGRLVGAPGELGVLLASGVIERAVCEREALWTWLVDGADWREFGPRVRDGLAAALADVDAWQVEAADDEVLALVAGDVIGREFGGYIASHGGQIELVSAAAGKVEVAMSGTCAHCPAAGFTLHERIERQINQRLATPVTVVAVGGGHGPAEPRGWLPMRLRRSWGG